jgi:NAD+ synthase
METIIKQSTYKLEDEEMNKQQEIIEALGVKSQIDPEQEIAARTAGLKEYLGEAGLKGYVLGISGVQDSLLAGLLAQKAVDELKQEGVDASFHAVLLPYGRQADAEDARLACDFIQPDFVHEWNIKSSVDALANEFREATGQDITDFDKGNTKARMRMIAQYALAGTYGLLVIGTDHAAEAVTGFFTKFGDGGADITPLSGLTKRQGKQLLTTLGAPARLYTKAPTADLLDGKPGRMDEDELGISYQIIDDYLEGKPIDPVAAAAIEKRYRITQHKRELPVVIGSLEDAQETRMH